MDNIICFLLTVLVAIAGGWLGYKLRFPGGLLVGAMAAVAIFDLCTEMGCFYDPIRVMLQLFSGAMVGSRIGKQELFGMKSLWKGVLVLIAAMIVLNIVFGSLIWLCGGVSLETAVFAAAPGSSQDMTIMSGEFGADVGMVAILQTARLMLIYLFIPPIIRFFDRKEGNDTGKKQEKKEENKESGILNRQLIWMLLFAIAIGMLFQAAGISAGAMVGAMIGSGAFCVKWGKQKYPQLLKDALQILSGAYVGMRLDRDALQNPLKLLIPVLIMLTGIFAFTFLTSAIVRRLTGIDRSTSMLASTPGGIQEMSLLSDELDADTPKVAIMHTARNMSVVLLFPFMIRFALMMIGELEGY